MKRNETNRIRSLKKSADYLKKSVIWVVVALILAAASAIITIIGPDKSRRNRQRHFGRTSGRNRPCGDNENRRNARVPVLFKRGVLVFAELYNGGRNA